MIPEGTYRAKAVQGDWALTKNDAEQCVVEFMIPSLNETIVWYGSLSENARQWTIKALRACGVKGEDIVPLEGLTDNEVELVIKHDEWEGKTRAKVKFVNAVGFGSVRTMDAARKKILAQALRGIVKQIESQEPPATDGKNPFAGV